ncbi:DUF1102 domain-containing protein [Halorientalis regularis]|uniref:DUF1102 domain-containing protein n=1 Tax=Halorientalis regularis TaxID=660518 RepID=A0A1G7SE98_9EURY|nr:DUF1102 domain-containing protein [Halorientalis regularis]SDG21224.1 Protein of unknown function [Halorientalis regularis]
MRRKLLALAALALAGTLLFSSAAAPGGDQIHEDVTLAPSDGPNGAYAVMEDGELTLRFGPLNPNVEGEGVNAGSVTPFHDVFTITYTGDQRARVWLTTDVEDIRFYRDDDPDDGLGSRETAVVLEPDETVSVGVLIDATDGSVEADADQFTVHAEVHDGTPMATDEAGGGGGDGGFDFSGGDDDGDGTETETPGPSPTDTPDGDESGTPDGAESGTPATGTEEGGIGQPGPGGGPGTPTATATVDNGGAAADDPGAAADPGSTPAGSDGPPWWWFLVLLGIVSGLLIVAGRLYAAE